MNANEHVNCMFRRRTKCSKLPIIRLGSPLTVIASRSSDKSAFEAWFRVQEEEGPVTIFTASHDGILHGAISDKYLVFG